MMQQTITEDTAMVRDKIKSISWDQATIIRWIMLLYAPKGFDLDPTYSQGLFYANIPQPRYKYDIDPQVYGVVASDCRELPHADGTINSIMFDPPFVAGTIGDGKRGIIKTRFGFYKTVNELWAMYRDALKEFRRVLAPDGVLVFKCQDTISSSQQWLSHVEVINLAIAMGFYPKDIFILLAHHRLMDDSKQQHARKFHSYFLVFIKKKSPVQYSSCDVVT